MNDTDKAAFISLFNEACENCFGFKITTALSEPDSRHMANKIFDQTGLVIGARSIKNYSAFVMSGDSRQENPSVSTLDTLARYVLDAPHTDEAKRQADESHFPYWFDYRRRYTEKTNRSREFFSSLRRSAYLYLVGLVIILGFYLAVTFTGKNRNFMFTENFNSVSSDTLYRNGWIIKSPDAVFWNLRGEMPGHITLYTLKGDNWPLGNNPAGIKNLLMRKINSDCFTVEIHMSGFVPLENWQQAGILLSEDSVLSGKMMRLSISYNDFFGGYKKPPEIIIQGISSSESGSASKPEEIAHITLFNLNQENRDLAEKNLSKSALKIEKRGTHYRFLSAIGPVESFTFKEIMNGDFNFTPRYVSLFSIQGWADSTKNIPVHFDSFSLAGIKCK